MVEEGKQQLVKEEDQEVLAPAYQVPEYNILVMKQENELVKAYNEKVVGSQARLRRKMQILMGEMPKFID